MKSLLINHKCVYYNNFVVYYKNFNYGLDKNKIKWGKDKNIISFIIF